MPRPPVTEAEKLALNNLANALNASETFYCTGAARHVGLSSPKLWYETDSGAKVLRIGDASDADLAELHSGCAASQIGQDLVMGDAPHQAPSARELLTDGFGFNFNPIRDDTGVLAAVSAFCKVGVVARIQKVKSFAFTKEGHVKVHEDGSKASNHIGTLLIRLSSPPDGLLLEHNGEKADIDWHEVHTQTTNNTLVLPWAFFYSDVQHEVHLVRPGHGVIIAYDIYSSKTVQYFQDPHVHAMDVTESGFYKAFDSFVKNPQLLPKGGVLAFGLANAYPAYAKESRRTFNLGFQSRPQNEKIHDSSDVVLHRVLTDLKMSPRLKAVYIEDGYDLKNDDGKANINDNSTNLGQDQALKPHGSLLDDFTCFEKSSGEEDEAQVLLTADSFSGINEYTRTNHGGDEDEGPMQRLIIELGAKIGWDIIWVKAPKVFYHANSFLNFGAFVDYNSVSAAFVVDIPRVVEGRREGF
ncbi:hypothetical protein FRB96_003615 [Tulasnella sp. 330]|nr:hypothetical protein FRB96_003615 [Tulasnella sp. 330]